MAENTEWEMYDGRALRPLLQKVAKEHNLPYEVVKKEFIKKYVKGSIARFEKSIQKVFGEPHNQKDALSNKGEQE